MAVIESEILVACEPDKLFEFLTQPSNFEKLTDPQSGLTLVEAPPRLSKGAKLKFLVEAFGIAQEIEHEITEFDPPRSFTEMQVRGPFQSWVHQHRVEPDGNGGARLIERVDFKPPGGLLGMLLNEQAVRKMIETAMAFRRERLAELAAAGEC